VEGPPCTADSCEGFDDGSSWGVVEVTIGSLVVEAAEVVDSMTELSLVAVTTTPSVEVVEVDSEVVEVDSEVVMLDSEVVEVDSAAVEVDSAVVELESAVGTVLVVVALALPGYGTPSIVGGVADHPLFARANQTSIQRLAPSTDTLQSATHLASHLYW